MTVTPSDYEVIKAADPANPAVVTETGPQAAVTVITNTAEWAARRVYSQYLSREVFTDPQGIEWVRISRQAYDPAKGDVEIAMKTPGLTNMTLRRRDAAAANLKGGDA